MSLMNDTDSIKHHTFAYYCSGHGYGHATRVVALTHELLRRGHRVFICTNAPEHVFSSTISSGASYRHAEIDAGIVQPKAYDVARRRTVQGLEQFLEKRPQRIVEEAAWLRQIKADAVLVDAPFLPCAAAHEAGIPAIIISNFTFDSCYSYLSVSNDADHAVLQLSQVATSMTIHAKGSNNADESPTTSIHTPLPFADSGDETEPPVPADYLKPLVDQAIRDYSKASLLLRLPGAIPIPAFDLDVPLPAPRWTDLKSHSFKQDIMKLLARDNASIPCNEQESYNTPASAGTNSRKRRVMDTPLITRRVSDHVYTPQFRSQLLASLGVPADLHTPEAAKILVVSFGGQSIPRPASRPPSPAGQIPRSRQQSVDQTNQIHQKNGALSPPPSAQEATHTESASMQRIMTQNHMYLPGAPPALHQLSLDSKQRPRTTSGSGQGHRRKVSIELHPTFLAETSPVLDTEFDLDEENLLPPGWIAIVCGMSQSDREGNELPPGFYAAPRDVYVPDLTATCDVLLGKLGYGTCSETVSTQTPFVYVPRPLFVEEFGLKRLMEQRGTALPMTRADFEAGRWSKLVLKAWELGRDQKEAHRQAYGKVAHQVSAAESIAREVEAFMSE